MDIEEINNALPQTQCGLCSYKGCKPYAEAIVNDGERINRCPPGGVRGLIKLSDITGIDASPYLEDMKKEQKPRMIAIVREDECIGCTKCIQACPVDAILGAAKLMHTVIADECNGCELCVEPCPVDCIDMIVIGELEEITPSEAFKKSQHYRQRYENREARLTRIKKEKRNKHLNAKKTVANDKTLSLEEKKRAVAEAMERARKKRHERK